ncbi:MAG: hypothetical protein JWR87_3110 [Segetibacter sp.]|nr:hypothetical protein [Segetibacter sp.]
MYQVNECCRICTRKVLFYLQALIIISCMVQIKVWMVVGKKCCQRLINVLFRSPISVPPPPAANPVYTKSSSVQEVGVEDASNSNRPGGSPQQPKLAATV